MSYRILAINPGSTSTKFALYDNEKQILVKSIDHKVEDLEKYDKVQEQFEMRKEKVLKALKENNIKLDSLSAIVGRGGLLPPVKSGAYLVNDEMIDRLINKPVLEHASNLGAIISYEISKNLGINAYIYDSVSFDELTDVARLSGVNGMDRECLSHALNSRAMAIKYAKDNNKRYEIKMQKEYERKKDKMLKKVEKECEKRKKEADDYIKEIEQKVNELISGNADIPFGIKKSKRKKSV